LKSISNDYLIAFNSNTGYPGSRSNGILPKILMAKNTASLLACKTEIQVFKTLLDIRLQSMTKLTPSRIFKNLIKA